MDRAEMIRRAGPLLVVVTAAAQERRNNGMQRTALRAAADAERSAARVSRGSNVCLAHPLGGTYSPVRGRLWSASISFVGLRTFSRPDRLPSCSRSSLSGGRWAHGG
jgi:hypothetical protein